MSNDPEERRSPKNELFDRADHACVETERLIAWAKEAVFIIKGSGGSTTVVPPREDVLSLATRHVAEGEHHVTIQQQRIAKLDGHGHAKLVARAWDVLDILETSLHLARDGLARVKRTREGVSMPGEEGGR